MRGSPTSSGDLLSLEPATHQIHNFICSHSSTVSKRQSALCSLPVLLLYCRSGRATLKTGCHRVAPSCQLQASEPRNDIEFYRGILFKSWYRRGSKGGNKYS